MSEGKSAMARGSSSTSRAKQDINNYCDFLIQQEKRKESEIKVFETSKSSSTFTTRGEDSLNKP